MIELKQRLTIVSGDIIGQPDERYYTELNVRAKATHVIPLGKDGLLGVLEDSDGLDVSFVVLKLVADGFNDGLPDIYELVFYGSGPNEGLREFRHTYWGDNGYIYYPSARIIVRAFRELERWFDCE